MAWSSDVAYLRGLEVMSAVVHAVPADGWQRPSPGEGWRAIDVLGPVGAGTEMGVRILRGGDLTFDPADPPGDAVEGDPVAWWDALAADARAATQGVDLDREVEGPRGRRTIREGLSFPAADLYLHGWDLAAATGVRVVIPEEASEFIHSVIDPIPDEMVRGGGVFGPERAAPPDADTVEALLAWSGRDPAWRPPEA
jgi:uncharacterized protein (TIGR03086 family)